MSADRLSQRGLADLKRSLSDRDREVIERLAELRLMSAAQLESMCFPTESFSTALSAKRVARRVLERLARDGLVARLDRRIGGVSAGSAGYIYALGPVGARLIERSGARRHFREPSTAFLNHTLDVSEMAVGLLVGQRSGTFEVLDLQTEPRCWRTFSGYGGHQLLRPDLFVSLGIGDFEHRLFLEIDRGTEHMPTLVRKCQVYLAYYRSDREQSVYGVFPTVWWIVPTVKRARQLENALNRTNNNISGLFRFTTSDMALAEVSRGAA